MGRFDPYGHRSPQNLWGKVKKETSTRSFNAHLLCLVQILRWKNPKDFDSHQSALIFPFEHIRQPSRSDGDVVTPYQLDRKYGGSRKLPYFTTEVSERSQKSYVLHADGRMDLDGRGVKK